jgi:hypothetical protein
MICLFVINSLVDNTTNIGNIKGEMLHVVR